MSIRHLLLTALGFFAAGALASQDYKSPLLQTRVKLEKERRNPVLYALVILREARVPGGIESISATCTPSFAEVSYPAVDGTVDEALRAAWKPNSNFRWAERDGQLSVTNSTGTEPSLLDVVVKQFSFDRTKTDRETTEDLFDLPEVKERATELRLVRYTQVIGFARSKKKIRTVPDILEVK